MGLIVKFLIVVVTLHVCPYLCENFNHNTFKWPTVAISVLVRNKAHTLPYFFSCLLNLDYPKDRIYIWIHSDFNEDNSIDIINDWAKQYGSAYNSIHLTTNTTSGSLHKDEKSSTHWSPEHFKHVINLREKALNFARKMWADFIFMLDADAFLANPLTLKVLINKDFVVAAPMLVSDGLYSNFWLAITKLNCLHAVCKELQVIFNSEMATEQLSPDPAQESPDRKLLVYFSTERCGMTEHYYYKRTEEYKPILEREKIGCFEVPMVHTAVLISLRHQKSDNLTYNPANVNNYNGPVDDIIVFALNAKQNGITLNICNDYEYGLVPVPIEDGGDRAFDQDLLLNVKLEAISREIPLPLDSYLEKYVTYPEKSKMGCSEIFVINLERRTERRKLMQQSMKELGIDGTLLKAVDGRDLDLCKLKDSEITLMPGYEDPYHKRPMKAGEVGCFLSHYYIWQEIADYHYKDTLILEDDVQFSPFFRQRFLILKEELDNLDWDLVYIGRKILLDGEEEHVTPHITRPLYSYWTLGYLLSERGAQKLLDAKPLDNLLPVDEFLPIMFDQHTNETWKSYFRNRNLHAFSAAPLLVHPTHYTGQTGYISDTEDSTVIDVNEPRVRDDL